MQSSVYPNAGYVCVSGLRWWLLYLVFLECSVNIGLGTGNVSLPTNISVVNCSHVIHLFELRHVSPQRIPTVPRNDVFLKFCEMSTHGTCCTNDMENVLAATSKLQLERSTRDSIGKLSSVLATRANKFNEFFKSLLSEAKKEFDIMFKRTYGLIYEQNSYVFSDLFTELENYYARGKVDLTEAMDTFFNVLYQKMFTVLNRQYSFDDKYLGCVSEHMKELKPFGDVPDKLSVQVKRSFVATRTYAQALNTAADVAKNMINIRLNAECVAALTKMNQCNLCNGYTEKPCANYCINVLQGCLSYYREIDAEWDNFVLSMERVSERLLGPFNIVVVVEPINIKISEAIMNFQESGEGISTQVFQGCGRPALGQKKRSITQKRSVHNVNDNKRDVTKTDSEDNLNSNEPRIGRMRFGEPSFKEVQYNQKEPMSLNEQFGIKERKVKKKNQHLKKNNNNNNNNGDDNNDNEPNLDKLVKDIKQKIKESKRFWSNLPFHICNNDHVAAVTETEIRCWNGSDVFSYIHPVADVNTLNPEFSAAKTRQNNILASQLFSLKTIINNLRNAYNGHDVEWSDQEDPVYGSGSGSGAGMNEDDFMSSGSGSIEETGHIHGDTNRRLSPHDKSDEAIVNTDDEVISVDGSFPKHKFPVHHNTTVGVEQSDQKVKVKNGASNISEQLTLRLALVLYLIPIYMTLLGSFRITVSLI